MTATPSRVYIVDDDYADKLQKVIAGVPVGHLGCAAYIADVAVMLSSADAYFANGACWDLTAVFSCAEC